MVDVGSKALPWLALVSLLVRPQPNADEREDRLSIPLTYDPYESFEPPPASRCSDMLLLGSKRLQMQRSGLQS